MTYRLPGRASHEPTERAPRIAESLRSARLRAGWSRETLAHHCGLTYSAIAQIESGRRQEVRLSSLTALAEALAVTVDYLVGGPGALGQGLLQHKVLLYGSEEEFVDSLVPYLLEGMERSDVLLAVTTSVRWELLRKALKKDGSRVEFAVSSDWYRSPIEALARYNAFVADRFEHGAPWIRIIGEPVWPARSAEGILAWTRYESLINLVFASAPATIVCPYDTRSLPDGILSDALHTHPTMAVGNQSESSVHYEEPQAFLVG